MKNFGRIVNIILWVVVIAIFLGLAVNNREPAIFSLAFYGIESDLSLEAPLYMLLFIALVNGFILGAATLWVSSFFRRRRQKS